MPLRLYDTLTRSTQHVHPMDSDTVRFYCCGPTVYGPAHIGNFRTFVMQDVFRRVVEADGTITRHVRNLTDVDDKTIRESQKASLTLESFTSEWTHKYHQDCQALNLLTPHVEPSAVAHIPEQVAMIEQLLASDHAYITKDGSVYFRIDSFAEYGKLSRLKEREITTTQVERQQSDEYERESAADFVLWKARRPEDGYNYWESPWGQGRPGWHLECSAMAIKHLGESFDLHSGGVDLIFPHHENEIAQSEATTNKPFVRHWFHIAHLMVDGEKMSKSLGNLYTLADIRSQGFTAEELRYVLLSANYRQVLNFTWDSLTAAKKALSRLRDFKQKLGNSPATNSHDFSVFHPVLVALQTDLNTADALGRLFKIIKTVQSDLAQEKLTPDQIHAARIGFANVMKAFGFSLTDNQNNDAPIYIKQLAETRWQAKQNKDWEQSDALRKELSTAGWTVKDTADSYTIIRL
ncbi:cysteine--tRNA ligase [Rubritalea spongiae]|uniref:Cysteine--tRNA ligase n=1 Tax=Rubritalea spongiae TaxID=430797 RepID=A0ABW5DZE7_9BACT